MQQDAHEFLNFLINHISEIILGEYWYWQGNKVFTQKQILAERQSNTTNNTGTTNNVNKNKGAGENGTANTTQNCSEPTWVQEIFQVIHLVTLFHGKTSLNVELLGNPNQWNKVPELWKCQ